MGVVPIQPINPVIFRAYDIRGLVGVDLTPDVAETLGRAFGTYLLRACDRSTIVLGHDGRETSPDFSNAWTLGLRGVGIDVTFLGYAPTPLVAFAAHQWGMGGAVSITASHSSAQFNGAKLLRELAMPLLPAEINAVQNLAGELDFEDRALGLLVERTAIPEYLAMLRDRYSVQRPLRVVADPGYGVATLTGPAALAAIGAEVIGIRMEMGGGGAGHVANPQQAESLSILSARVIETGADLGIAWDEDGDRVGIVDEAGRRYEADWIVALLARGVISRSPGSKILMDLKSSRGPISNIKAYGGEPVLAKTGYSTFRRQMREQGILFGGELSGHIMFGEGYPYIDDGVMAACAVVEAVAAGDRPLSSHLADIPRFVTSPEIMLPCPDAAKFKIIVELTKVFAEDFEVNTVDGIRIEFKDGWVHLRASNTMPVLSVRIEAESLSRYEMIQSFVRDALQTHPDVTITSEFGNIPQ